MTFEPGQRVRTNQRYIAAGGPRAVRKPWSGVVVDVGEVQGVERIKVIKDRTKYAQWYSARWFCREE